ncbi:hypothetical protein MASR1M90_11780 [Desulfovibrionales bacterium]
MSELSDITLYRLTKTMGALDQLYHADPDLYEDFIGEICTDFTLAREYMLAIQEMNEQGMHQDSLMQADLTLRHLLALWIVHADVDVPLAEQEHIQ